MITQLSLKNFKLHGSTTIEAAPITIFIGPNNSGKSSIFQALLIMREAASAGRVELCVPVRRQETTQNQPYLFAQEQLIDVGEFKDIVRRGQKEMQIGLAGTLNPETQVSKYGDQIDVQFEVYIRNNRPTHHSGHLASPYGRFSWEWAEGIPTQRQTIAVEGVTFHFQSIGDLRLVVGSRLSFPPGFSPQNTSGFAELHAFMGTATTLLLESVHPIFPLRGFEEWGYPLLDAPATNLERLALNDRMMALASILAYDPDLLDKLSLWLEDLLGVGIKTKLLPGKRVTIQATHLARNSMDSSFTNEGTGANQLPFILVPIGLTPTKHSVWLCEPEAHLHPKAQSGLVSLLLKIATKEERQFFIETHSEHILHSFLHAVAKGELGKSEIAIYYFENVKGTAEVRRLEVDDKGRIEGGLPGFFEHSLTELSEYLDVLKKT